MLYIMAFVTSVAADVVSYYICKLLDRMSSDNQHKDQ